MTKKIEIKKIETMIPYDAFISKIANITGEVKHVNLEVYFTSKEIHEIKDTMFAVLNMCDSSGEMKAILVGNRDNEFVSLVNKIKHGLKYRISGNICTLSDEIDEVKLPFIDELKNTSIFCIYALQCYSDTIYGIDLNEFNSCTSVNEEYKVIKKYTSYLNNISEEEVKDIKVSAYGEIVTLLNDGTLYINDENKLENIKTIHYINSHTICAISKDNVITVLTKKGICNIDYLNNNNYQYKKILVTEFGIAALTHEGVVIYFGDISSSIIDHTRFIDIDDIDYEEDSGGITVIKKGKKYSLFHLKD